jgi:hypothetical protein
MALFGYDFMNEVSDSLEPGGSAIFMPVYKATEELSRYGGHLWELLGITFLHFIASCE